MRTAETVSCSPLRGLASISATHSPPINGVTGSETHHVLTAGGRAIAYRRSPDRNASVMPATRMTTDPTPRTVKLVSLMEILGSGRGETVGSPPPAPPPKPPNRPTTATTTAATPVTIAASTVSDRHPPDRRFPVM
jgi:hypothetical protein